MYGSLWKEVDTYFPDPSRQKTVALALRIVNVAIVFCDN
jgi:hypothetical protein